MYHPGGGPSGSTREPIPIYLVSHEFSLDDRVRHIRTLLGSTKEEQESAKSLESTNASRLIDLLDQVLRGGRLDEKYQPSCIRYLARVCGWHTILPSSVRISNYMRETNTPHDGGGNSTVFMGSYNGQKVVITTLHFYKTDSDVKKRELIRKFCKEVVIWKNLSHPNILPFVGATLVTEQKREKYEIVSEFMVNGDIRTFIQRFKGVNRLELLKDVATGLSYLHSRRVVHGELRVLNILINDRQRACLANFGRTRIIAEFTSSGAGYPKDKLVWMSPELLSPEQPNSKEAKPTKESDVYALGVLIYEVICGHRPFPQLREPAAVDHFRKGKLPDRPSDGFTDSLWGTLESCWQVRRENRPSAEAVKRKLDEASRA